MAVKPEKIKERLKIKYPKANLSQKRIDTIVAKLAPMPADDADDVAVDAILDQANSFNSFEDVAKEDDRVRTLENKANVVTAPVPTPELVPATITPVIAPTDETPIWAKALIESNQKLTADIEAIKTGKIIETKKQTAQSVFDASEILKGLKPEIRTNWLSRIDVNSQTLIEDQVKNLETEFTDIRQSVAETTRYSGAAPSGANGNKPDDKMIESIVNEIT